MSFGLLTHKRLKNLTTITTQVLDLASSFCRMVLEVDSSVLEADSSVEDDLSVLDLGSSMAKVKLGFNRRSHKRQKIGCPCGCMIRRDGKSVHLKSKKHTRWLAGKKFDQKVWSRKTKRCPKCGSRQSNANLARHQKTRRCLKATKANRGKDRTVKQR